MEEQCSNCNGSGKVTSVVVVEDHYEGSKPQEIIFTENCPSCGGSGKK